MSTSTPSVPKVRTYAADLALMRSSTSTPTPRTTTPTITEKPVVDTSPQQVIPPFHTFSKSETTQSPVSVPATPIVKTAVVSDSQIETQKILSSTSARTVNADLKESLPAVIITDTKRKRFRLTEAIADSLQGWWSNKKLVAQQKKIPKYTVPVAERRKGVIQKATAKTGRASTADHNAVISRIKATKQSPTGTPDAEGAVGAAAISSWESGGSVVPKPAVTVIQNQRLVKRQTHVAPALIAQPKLEPEPAKEAGWETDIQTKVNSLAEPSVTEPSKIILTGQEFTKIKQARAEENLAPAKDNRVIKPIMPPVVQKSAVKTIPVITPQVPKVSIAVPAREAIIPQAVPAPVARTPEIIAPTPYTRPKIAPIIPNVLTAQTAAVEPVMPETVAVASTVEPSPEPQQPERRFAPPREDKRNFWSLFTQTNRIVFITFGVFIFVIAGGLGIRAYQNIPEEMVPTTTPITETAFTDSAVYTETNLIQNKTQLSDRIKTSSSDVDSLVEISFLNETGIPLTAANFFSLFDATVPFDFVSSINDITFGNYRGAPWILMTVSDKNTALGGMLAWESSLGRNLAPIFSTAEPTSYARFTDSIVGSIDVRSMKNEDGTGEIMYGFIGTDKLLITSNNTAFLNLAQKIY